jgi:hypothetical protein
LNPKSKKQKAKKQKSKKAKKQKSKKQKKEGGSDVELHERRVRGA